MRDTSAAAIATNRFGLGARPGEIAACAGDPRGWLEAQLKGAPPLIPDSGLQSTAAMVTTIDRVRAQNRALRGTSAAGDKTATPSVVNAVVKLGEIYRPQYVAEVTARLTLAATTERPFLERITQFWSNHFAISVDKAIVLGVAGSYEREAIRPHVLGSFAQLLLAVERHPAMLLYLDNYRSVGPDSMLAGRALERAGKTLGINENLAREIMELHTLGVNGGYTQADVTAFAKVITGWSIGARGAGARRRRRRPENFSSAPISTSPAPRTSSGAAMRSKASPRASRCCWIWRAIRRPRSTSQPSWRGTSSPMIHRPMR